MIDTILSVSALASLARQQLESTLPLCWVSGEVSGIRRAASGHVYFTLKDEAAQIRCILWRNRAQLLGFQLTEGQRVEAQVLATLYEARGEFQLRVENLRQAGQGALYEQFLKIRARLAAEGLFESQLKRQIPVYPRRVGIISSLNAAALHDVLITLRRRAPHLAIYIFPTLVQGVGSCDNIIQAISNASEACIGCDVLIICRGGGSIEDLASFNDESVARAIHACPLPIVCGIGHETDFTISDFVADVRAATPTAAAELICPDNESLQAELSNLHDQLRDKAQSLLYVHMQRLDIIGQRLQAPKKLIESQWINVQRIKAGLKNNMQHWFELQYEQHERFAAGLRQLDPDAVISRGYSLVCNEAGQIVSDVTQLQQKEQLKIEFSKGTAQVRVEKLDSH